MAGEASRKFSTPDHVSDSLRQILFSATPLWFKISTRKIPKKNAKRVGSHGIPENVISVNGPQHFSAEFAKFAEDWGLTQIISSPKYPQSNGEAERMMQTAKNLLTKSVGPFEALLAYRATPLENGFSPAELCMGRRLHTTLPLPPSKLTPQWPELTKLREKEANIKTEQTKEYNRRHAVKELSSLSPGDCVYIPDRKGNAVVVAKTPKPPQLLEETDGSSIQILRK